MLVFCPTCGNMLLVELEGGGGPLRYACQTCPYVQAITRTVRARAKLAPKVVEDVFDDERVWANAQRTNQGVWVISCTGCVYTGLCLWLCVCLGGGCLCTGLPSVFARLRHLSMMHLTHTTYPPTTNQQRQPKTTTAVCPACRGPDAFFAEMQTRSADEPATVFYRCAARGCGRVWTEN
jgi:DNA-directed RNA polymerase subunit M/transcription elongation factor TFIIS